MKTSLFGLALLCASAVPSSPPESHPAPAPLAGVVQPSRVVRVGAAVDGLLADVFVDRGDVVEEGRLVARLASDVERANARLARARSELAASRDALEARLLLAEDQLARRVGLLDDGIVSTNDVLALRAEVRLAKLALREADERTRIAELEYRRAEAVLAQGEIRSPIDGVVVDRLLSPGEVLSRSGTAEVVVLARMDPLVVELHAPLELLPHVERGDVARIDFVGLALDPREARVTIVDRIVDTASSTFRVRLELPNPDLGLPAGLRCDVTFEP
jgi:RND family efflux transporter MFP subunit